VLLSQLGQHGLDEVDLRKEIALKLLSGKTLGMGAG
jgi:hypothetical protein